MVTVKNTPLPDTWASAMAACGEWDLQRVIFDWSRGAPTHELAFLNRATERFLRYGRAYRLPWPDPYFRGKLVEQPEWHRLLQSYELEERFHQRQLCRKYFKNEMRSVNCELGVLHAADTSGVDKYGADIAISVHARWTRDSKTPTEEYQFSKIAVFQTKKSANHRVQLQKHQLDTMLGSEFATRGFVFAVDESTKEIWIRDANKLRMEFTAKEKQFFTTDEFSGWTHSLKWLQDWLKCDVGEPGTLAENLELEALLKAALRPRAGGLETTTEALTNDIYRPSMWLNFEVVFP